MMVYKEVCFYCQLDHPEVEAGGVYYCPNRLCTGPGQCEARRKLKSYEDLGSKYTFDTEELVDLVIKEPHVDPLVRAAEERSLPKWRTPVETPT